MYHDFNIYKYQVDAESQAIRLFLKEHHGDRKAMLEFSGVVGHYFRHVLEGNIILDVAEVDANWLYGQCEHELVEYRRYGLAVDSSTERNFISDIVAKQLNCYYISSSYGLSGWIIAKVQSVNA